MKYLYISLLLLASCHAPTRVGKDNSKGDSSARAIDSFRRNPWGHPKDSLPYEDASEFMRSLISFDGIKLDTACSFTEDRLPAVGGGDDSMDTSPAVFPFKDIPIQYLGKEFLVKNILIKDECPDSGERIGAVLRSIRRFKYGKSEFVTCKGHLRSFNGSGGRITFNYFFDISRKSAIFNAYNNFELGDVFLYGDLDKNEQLDRIVFDGVLYPAESANRHFYNYVMIAAQTYTDKKWIPLKDKAGKAYKIKIKTDGDMGAFAIDSFYWMNKLPLKK